MKKCGIYVIKNKINDLVYVGQSVDIMCRWYAHIQAAKDNNNQSHKTKIHQAMHTLGIDNFYIEIIEECNYELLSEREIYWIKQYNSYNHGYNMTLGGEANKGETNGRALLTQAQVEDIRLAYGNHICFKQVYEKYKNTISKRGLQNVWHFKTWRHIMPEVYNDENRKWHATQSKANIDGNLHLGSNNKNRACSEEEIAEMRRLRKEGLSYKKISSIVGRSESVVRKYCLFEESKSLNKIGNSIVVKNIETGLIFESYTKAAKWAKCGRKTISRNINTTKTAGIVPTTNEPAHWISL